MSPSIASQRITVRPVGTAAADWNTRQPHPFHGPPETLPRKADGSIPAYYYLSPEEIVRTGAMPPALQTEPRRAGLTPDRQAAFLDALAATGTVSGACALAGISRMSAYRERNHPDAAGFRDAWAATLRRTVRVLADAALERAIEGVEETVYYKGMPVGTRRRHNERLTMFLLRVLDPATFGAAGERVAGPAAGAGTPRLAAGEAGGDGPSTACRRVTSVTNDAPAVAGTPVPG